MDKLGVDCLFRTPKDYPAGEVWPFTGEMVDFFIRQSSFFKTRAGQRRQNSLGKGRQL
jgi:hypothetical protein